MPFGEPTKRAASPADWARAAAELVAARALFASLPEAERLSVRAEAQAEAAACPPGALRQATVNHHIDRIAAARQRRRRGRCQSDHSEPQRDATVRPLFGKEGATSWLIPKSSR